LLRGDWDGARLYLECDPARALALPATSGVFYASAANKLKGPLVDQADIFSGLLGQVAAAGHYDRVVAAWGSIATAVALMRPMVPRRRPIEAEGQNSPRSPAAGSLRPDERHQGVCPAGVQPTTIFGSTAGRSATGCPSRPQHRLRPDRTSAPPFPNMTDQL
jgi:hypothetical protein